MGVRVVVADSQEFVRAGVQAAIADEPDMDIVGQAADGLEAVRLTERARPDVLLLGLMLPCLGGIEVLRQIGKRAPGVRAVVMSTLSDPGSVSEALQCGALGYVLKDASPSDVIQAIREAAAGRRHLAPPLCAESIDAYMAAQRRTRPDPYDALTTREREVLHLTAEGRTSSEIGQLLYISPRTVEGHRGALMRKLGLSTQTDVVRYAVRRGIVRLE